ncbi:MAG: 5'-3'-deoxyribonucleotidase [Ignavibacteria bacterium]|nr:5'-3'-deoxyribonucleotidase [Ignavibacteria bacterium]
MRLLIDMDGVIADFEGDFLRRWKETHPEKTHIPLEERKGFYVREQYPDEFSDFVQEIYHSPGFYQNLPPMPGAIEALKEIKNSLNHVFLCTSPMLPKYENCVLEKFHWVYEHLGTDWVNNIILTRDKTVVKGDVLIDDKPDIKGSCIPEWEHVIYDQPYNRNITGSRRLTWDNWKEVLNIQ